MCLITTSRPLPLENLMKAASPRSNFVNRNHTFTFVSDVCIFVYLALVKQYASPFSKRLHRDVSIYLYYSKYLLKGFYLLFNTWLYTVVDVFVQIIFLTQMNLYCFTLLVLFTSIDAMTSALILSSIVSVVSFGFHPIDLDRSARHREFEPKRLAWTISISNNGRYVTKWALTPGYF